MLITSVVCGGGGGGGSTTPPASEEESNDEITIVSTYPYQNQQIKALRRYSLLKILLLSD